MNFNTIKNRVEKLRPKPPFVQTIFVERVVVYPGDPKPPKAQLSGGTQ